MSMTQSRIVLDKILEIELVFDRHKSQDISLLQGDTGIAIFYLKLFQLTNKKLYFDKLRRTLDKIISTLPKVNISPSLYSGFTGVAWGLCHIQKELKLFDEDIFSDLEEHIYTASELQFQIENYDFLHGALGSVIFALDRMPSLSAYNHISKILDELIRIRHVDEYGITWEDKLTSQHHPKKLKESKAYNLGLAHGVPSITNILLSIYSAKLYPDRSKEIVELINLSLEWIQSCTIKDKGHHSLFPGCVFDHPKNFDGPTKLSWCYGDLTMAWVFWRAGTVLGSKHWLEQAMMIMGRCLTRFQETTDNIFLDACFCHGTSGIAYIFKKFYGVTRDERFKDAANFWISETINFSKHPTGLAGYKTYMALEDNPWKNMTGLLEGVCGVGLVLIDSLGATSDWDKCLLLNSES